MRLLVAAGAIALAGCAQTDNRVHTGPLLSCVPENSIPPGPRYPNSDKDMVGADRVFHHVWNQEWQEGWRYAVSACMQDEFMRRVHQVPTRAGDLVRTAPDTAKDILAYIESKFAAARSTEYYEAYKVTKERIASQLATQTREREDEPARLARLRSEFDRQETARQTQKLNLDEQARAASPSALEAFAGGLAQAAPGIAAQRQAQQQQEQARKMREAQESAARAQAKRNAQVQADNQAQLQLLARQQQAEQENARLREQLAQQQARQQHQQQTQPHHQTAVPAGSSRNQTPSPQAAQNESPQIESFFKNDIYYLRNRSNRTVQCQVEAMVFQGAGVGSQTALQPYQRAFIIRAHTEDTPFTGKVASPRFFYCRFL
jgi:hypothetical protein